MTRRRLGALAAALAIALAPPAAALAQPAPPLTLSEVTDGLARTYPPLLAAEQERRAAEAELLGAEGAFDAAWRTRAARVLGGAYPQTRLDTVVEQPTTAWGATLFGGYRLGAGSFAIYDGKLETNPGGELRAGLSIPLWRNGPIDRRRASIARAEAGLLQADAAASQQRLDAARQAAHRFWDWAAAGRRLRIARELLALATRRASDLEAGIRLGQLPAIERAENERAIYQRRAQVVAAERALTQAGLELSLFVRGAEGLPQAPARERLPRELPPPAAGPDAELAGAVAVARRARPEPRRLAAQIEMAQVELALARNQLAPAVDLSVVGSQDLGEGTAARALPELEAGVFLDVPLQARAPRGRLAAAEAALRRLEAQARFTLERVEVDVRDVASAMALARQRFFIARQERELALTLEGAERERFRLGEGTLFLVNLREQASAEAATREVDALAEYHRARASYHAALGEAPR